MEDVPPFAMLVTSEGVISAPWSSRKFMIVGWLKFAALERMYLRSSAVGSAKEASDCHCCMRDCTPLRLSVKVASFNSS